MSQSHHFQGALAWTGTNERDAQGALNIERKYLIEFEDVAPLEGSAPPVFKGDRNKHNPETLMISSLMACHHLTYVALCERSGIELRAYSDRATGTLAIKDGKMRMVEVTLRPQVQVADPAQLDKARALHEKAHAGCFMANSVNFEVKVEAEVKA